VTVSAPAAPTAAPDRFYATLRRLARFWVWFFFRRVDVRHAERVPMTGPVLLCINHPNNLIDSLLVGAVVPRKVHYLATATLFRHQLLARLLLAAGAIPVHRRQDAAVRAERPERAGPRQSRGEPMNEVRAERPGLAGPINDDPNTAMFATCHRAFAEGQVIAIYPEGTTHAEARVQRIRTGAARIALGYLRAGDLTVIPVGLSFEARKSFKGRVLVSFGPAVPITPYLDTYASDPVRAVDALTTAIQWGMEAEVVHVERIDATGLVRAVEDLYRSELVRQLREERGLAERQVDVFRLSRTIVDAVSWFKTHEPQRVERLWQRIQGYRALLEDYHVRDEAVRARLQPHPVARRLVTGWEAIVGFPVFAYGLAVNALPFFVPRWLARTMSHKETDYATVRLLTSIVAVPVFWTVETWIVWRVAGPAWAALFALSLPISGVLAYHYLRGLGRLRRAVRFGALALTRAQAARALIAERQALIAELDRARDDYLASTRGSTF